MQRYLPIAISLEHRACLVVGGGGVALRKIERLLDYGADVTVIAPSADERVEFLAREGRLVFKKRDYLSPEAGRFGLVISAVDSTEVNLAVHRDCTAAGVPVNVVDNPALCDFIFPALVQRDCLSIAISTDGRAPFLARRLRRKLETAFPDARWKKIASAAAEFRRRTLAHVQNAELPTDAERAPDAHVQDSAHKPDAHLQDSAHKPDAHEQDSARAPDAHEQASARKARLLERFLAFDWEGEIDRMNDRQIEEALLELMTDRE